MAGELHALGSTMYEILTSHIPFWEEEKSYEVEFGYDGKAEELMRERKYPDVMGMPLGDIVAQCWAASVMVIK
ncbi:hypothetical protein SCUCBS95973_008959 [Sporothrix curviconia]|uniref:Protein kinase domain-containing protein n=1 Tax=Sporothrix curviconia TaxID=1260050 RepID=A0ABP0CQX5_9PEZI